MMPEQLEDLSKYKIDILNTIFGNILWITLMCFIFLYMFYCFDYVTQVESTTERLIILIVFMLSTVRLVKWCGHPHIAWRRRK